jgi:hypothetical protein
LLEDIKSCGERLVFFLPVGGYWLLAILTAFHLRPLWVLSIFAPPLVLMAGGVVCKFRVDYGSLL